MTRWPGALAMAGFLALAARLGAAQGTPPDGFEALWNGRDLAGFWGAETEDPRVWQALPAADLAQKRASSLADVRAHWRVENGELVNDGQGLYLTTEREFGDFELLVDYRTVPGADSGVYLRGCPQVQIWDTTEAGGKWNLGADQGSGGLWNNSPGAPGKDPLVHADRPFGEWNHLRIVMVGERVSVWLNEVRVVDHARMENYFDRSLPLPRRGPIQLQTHGGEIRWRELWIREIQPAEADAILAGHGGDGFEPLWNGRDFDGWAGPIDEWEVADGALQCRPGKGGTIFARRELADFVVRLGFLLPPGGNNGLAVRYPGEGDTAYTGMCELQVLDSDDPRYAGLDPRQHHGSAYGQAAAHRGHLRPAGTWNFQEVTVRGHRVTVELNGTRVLDADLAAVTDFLYEPEKFAGRLRTNGHFGLCGHNDPVRFRDLQVRPIE